MLLGSNAIASAPLMADAERAYGGTTILGRLELSAAALLVEAALFSGAAAVRQYRPSRIAPVKQTSVRGICISENRTITL
ncbi:MAG: hypothetical protein AB3N28_09035 [Kordiimonas sp.]